ncbi:DUF3427 domain-containing protein [Brevibacterium samyangense]|uniref:DUF3427 domain-containing protein n=1 Tax=Brevibacterium samyangense TaxID=366888 RepID=A0ABN2TG41_9MICO
MVVNDGEEGSALRILREELKRSTSFDWSVAFVTSAAVAMLKQELADFSGQGRITTSTYLGFNKPEALRELLHLERLGVEVRLHDLEAFHPKGYIFENEYGITAMVGSSNLTERALTSNREWNLKVSAHPQSDLAGQFHALVEQQLNESTRLSEEWIDEYARTYVPMPRRKARRPANLSPESTDSLIVPNDMQTLALASLEQIRSSGERRALVISATGTGKTILSALEIRQAAPRRALFIVHREQILDRTIEEFKKVLPGAPSDFGKVSGASRDLDAKHVFATVQTLARPEVLNSIPRDAFDYVIVDEAHRATANQHRAVIDYLEPDFLLGMTATPERMDGADVYALFDHNLAYEIRLNDALENDMLAPFHYYGVADVDFVDGKTSNAKDDLSKLSQGLRVQHIVDTLEKYGHAGTPVRGLMFCSRNEEAARLSAALNGETVNGRPLRTAALSGKNSVAEREALAVQLAEGNLDYLLTVDIFNEGIDIPSVNQVVFLRQTQSSIVFTQQLGRGLRKAPGKEYLVAIDFIGNYDNNYLIPIALFGDRSFNKENIRKALIDAEEQGVTAGVSSIHFDRVAHSRVLESLSRAKVDGIAHLKPEIVDLRNKLGRIPRLVDFHEQKSVDPVLIGSGGSWKHYDALMARVFKLEPGFSAAEERFLLFLGQEVLTAKRMHEALVLRELLEEGSMALQDVRDVLATRGLVSEAALSGALDTLTLTGFSEGDTKKYGEPLASLESESVALNPTFRSLYEAGGAFAETVDDAVATSLAVTHDRYGTEERFVIGKQYSRRDVARTFGWPRSFSSTLYGYRVYEGECPLFITLNKSDDVSATTAYKEGLIDHSSMSWSTKSNRTLKSAEIQPILNNTVRIEVFVKNSDAEGTDYFYLGRARAANAVDSTMADEKNTPVVEMILNFEEPIGAGLYDYFHPTVVTSSTAFTP